MAGKKRMAGRIGLALGVLLVVLAGVFSLALGPVVRQAVERVGPGILGVPIEVQSVRIYPWTGVARIEGLTVGPPEGFASNLVEMKRFRMLLRPASVFTDTLVFREIVIEDSVVTYELSGLRSNVNAVLDGLARAEEKPDEAPAKKVVIEHFRFAGGRVRLSTTLTGGRGVALPLPTVELRDIGKPREGVTRLAAIRRTTTAVLATVLTTVRDGVVGIAGLGADTIAAVTRSAGAGLEQVGRLAGSALQGVGRGAVVVGDAAVSGARAAGDAAGGAARAVGGAAGSGARAVGDTAGGAARAVGGAAGSGARAVGDAAGGAARAVGGLLGRRPEAAAEDAAVGGNKDVPAETQ